MSDKALKQVITHVLCNNSMGEPDIHTTMVELSQEGYDNGEHYDIAIARVEEEGYEALHAFDQFDAAGKKVLPDNPTVLVVVSETGISEVVSDIPMKLVVVSTDTEHTEEDCLFKVELDAAACQVSGHVGECVVMPGEAARILQVVEAFHSNGNTAA